MSEPGHIENYYGCCDRPPTFTVGAGSDRCPEHGGEAFSRWVPSRAEPAAGPPESLPEIERLKAENASLLESLRVAEQLAESRGRMLSGSEALNEKASRVLAAAEQRAEAAEKHLAEALATYHAQVDATGAAEERRAAAEQRNTALTGLLREALAGFQWGGNAKALDFAVRASAALHDEERRPRDYDPITAPIPEGDMNGPHGPLHTPDDEERSAPPQEEGK